MNRRIVSYSSLPLLCAAMALGQSAPTASNTAEATAKKDDTLVLSPFTVDAKKDVGFVAASALAGGRLATALKDTPVAYSSLTRETIDALNITDLSAATKWTVNANNVNDDGRGVIFADELGTKLSFRGVQSTATNVSQQQLDFFPVYYNYDSYNLDRFDFARGPNSILFGAGSNGGTPVAMTKRARLDQPFEEVRALLGSWGYKRATLDVNRPIGKNLAARVNVLWQDGKGWRDREFNDRTAASVALTYQPFQHTTVRVTAERGTFKQNVVVGTLGDRISGWDGTTTFAGVQPVSTLPANANAAGIGRTATTEYPVYVPGEGLMNWANTAVTLGGNANAQVAVGGQLVASTGGGYAGGPMLDAEGLPGNAFALATAGSQFRVPGRSFTSSTTDRPSFVQRYQNYSGWVEQQVGDHVFLSVSGNYNQGQKTTDYTAVRGLNDVYIDINKNLPSGAANPNYLVPYDESIRFRNLTNFDAHSYRANAAFVFDNTGFGSYRANLEVSENLYTTPRIQYVYTLKDPAVNSRDWPVLNNVRYRYYWNNNARPEDDLGTATITEPGGATRTVDTGFVIDSQRQNNTSRTIADFKYAQAYLNGSYFNDKLNLSVGVQRAKYKSQADQSLFRRDYADGWDGQTFIWRPRAPSDYFTLAYTPKDANGNPTGAPTAAVTRPRDGNGNRLGQYANDRFQSDYSSPIVQGSLTTYSTGAVVHPTPWLSLFGNYAETYNPPSPSIRINGLVFNPLLSKGWDAGVRLNLIGDKLIFTATQYGGKQDNVTLGTGTGDGLSTPPPTAFNAIIDANIIGDQSPTGINKRSMQEVPLVYFDTASRQSKGTEFELTANPLPGWRALANIAFPKTTQSNAYADTRAFYTANTGVLKQILSDAGVIVGGDNVARVDQSIPVNQQSPDASAAAAGWNNLQTVLANFVTAPQPLTRLARVTANVFTDYTFTSGTLKGLRVGAGINYRGREVIGFRGADKIVDPSNPTKAIDDPAVDALTPVYRAPYHVGTAAFGYTFNVRQDIPVTIDLTIDNVLNEQTPLYYNTVQRPVGANLASPAAVATPYQYSYLVPRNYTLSVTVKF